MQKYNVLLVDDDLENLSVTKELLSRWGYDVDAVSSGQEAIDCIKTRLKEYAVGLLDYQMPEKTGTETAEEIRSFNDEMVVLIYSAYPSMESLRATIRAGALNFIEKNDKLNELKMALEKACQAFEKVRRVIPPLSPSEVTRLIASLGMVGRSEKLARVAGQVHTFRPSKKPVLVLGETGVGKELVAQALHVGPKDLLFSVNCAALQGSSLIESELFGHEKGAFTGAVVRKVGILEAAKGGTVFLDEIHCLDLQSQSKLLRAIREKKIRRVGGLREENVDFRLVASSRPDIEDRVKNGTFLPDLYYRLKFLTIEIPPLRERPEDIEPLVLHFCEKYFQETGIRKHFLIRTLRRLEQFQWEGNVGELDGMVSGLLTSSPKDSIDEALLEEGLPVKLTSFDQLVAKQEHERIDLFKSALRVSNSMRHAARLLGLKPSSFFTLLARMGLKDEGVGKRE